MKIKLPYRKKKQTCMAYGVHSNMVLTDVSLRLSVLFSQDYFLCFKFNYYIESFGGWCEKKDFMDCFKLMTHQELPKRYSYGD